MFRLLATTKCVRQQIAILIISFFAYVAGIRNEGDNMLQQQQQLLQQRTIIEDSNKGSPLTEQSALNFRPSTIIDFTQTDAFMPLQHKPTSTEDQNTANGNKIIRYNSKNNNINNNIQHKQETQSDYRGYVTIETAATNANAAKKQFSFPNERQEIPQYLTDKPIYVYRDPFTNENHHHTPTEANAEVTTIPTRHSHNNYNIIAHNQQHSQHHLHHDDNQEYLVQSSMTVATEQANNPFRPYMSLSAEKDVYLKRPGFVYDVKPSYTHTNSVIAKKSVGAETLKVNKISYNSHDYPPPSYSQQQTSNFLPTPVPAQTSPSRPALRPTTTPTPPQRLHFEPNFPPKPIVFGQQRPQQQYLQTSQTALSNYANSIDNYLLNKQQPSDRYRKAIASPSPSHLQYFSQPLYNSAETSYPHYETSRPTPAKFAYNNYYGYQKGEIPPPYKTSPPPSQQFNYSYPRPPPQYPYQGSYRPTPAAHHQQQSGLATLAQYAPKFTSLFLGGIGNGNAGSNTNSPLGSILGALTGTTGTQQSSASSSSPSSSSSSSSPYSRRPINSQLLKALENIAHNDDLQCVPNVLCQMIAAQTERGQLPAFITSPTISNFLEGFPASSPALIYGRAALLGLSGGQKRCLQSYHKCPKGEYEIIYYLNNHRGGFFKFFSEPVEAQQSVIHAPTQPESTSLFSILTALTGSPQATTSTTSRPTSTSTDITSGIGNFFTQLLSDYMGGASVEYQRSLQKRTKRSPKDTVKFEGESESDSEQNHSEMIKFQDDEDNSESDTFIFEDNAFDIAKDTEHDYEEDFHDEEDEQDTQLDVSLKNADKSEHLNNLDGRTSLKTVVGEKQQTFFPEIRKETSNEMDKNDELQEIIEKFNDFNRRRKLKFPTAADKHKLADDFYTKLRQRKELKSNLYLKEQSYASDLNNYIKNSFEDIQKESQKGKFMDIDGATGTMKEPQYLNSNHLNNAENPNTKFISPTRKSKILNYPPYAAPYLQDYEQQVQFEPEAQSDLDYKFTSPNGEKPSSYTGVVHINSVNTQNRFSANTAVHNNIFFAPSSANTHNGNSKSFLPTPIPSINNYASSSSFYTNKDHSSSQHIDNTLKQSASFGIQKDADVSSFSASPSKGDSYTFHNRHRLSFYTTKQPTTTKSNDENIYVTNSRGVTEYFVTPDGRKVYL